MDPWQSSVYFVFRVAIQVHRATFLYLKTVPSWNRKWKMEWALPVVIPTQRSTLKNLKNLCFFGFIIFLNRKQNNLVTCHGQYSTVYPLE